MEMPTPPDQGDTTGGREEEVEDLLGVLCHFLGAWIERRDSILPAIARKPTRGHRICPDMVQRMAVVIGDLGNVIVSQTPHPPSPLSIPEPTTSSLPCDAPLARHLVEKVRNLGRPSPTERESIVAMVRSSSQVPLSEHVRVGLARMSYRQLKRLPKSKLTEEDKLLLNGIIKIKHQEAGFK